MLLEKANFQSAVMVGDSLFCTAFYIVPKEIHDFKQVARPIHIAFRSGVSYLSRVVKQLTH